MSGVSGDHGKEAAIEAGRIRGAQAARGETRADKSSLAALHEQVSAKKEVLTKFNEQIKSAQPSTTGKSVQLSDSFQKGMNTELSSLQKNIKLLQNKLPESSKNLKQFQEFEGKLSQMMEGMNQSPPKVNGDEVESLHLMLAMMNDASKDLPDEAKAEFFETQEKMFDDLDEVTKQQSDSLQNQYKSAEGRKQLYEAKSFMDSFFSKTPPLKIDKEFLQMAQALKDHGQHLTEAEKKQLDSYLAKISEMKVKLRSGKEESLSSILNRQKVFLDSAPKEEDEENFYSEFSGLIDSSEEEAPSLEIPFSEKDKSGPSKDLATAAKSVKEASDKLGQAKGASKVAKDIAAGKSPQLSEDIQGGENRKHSLANDFYDMILNKYMPKQEAYLRGQAKGLAWDNYKSEMYNTLIGDTAGFANAKEQMNFSDLLKAPIENKYDVGARTKGMKKSFELKGSITTYNGDPEMARAKLQNEKETIATKLTSIDTASEHIDKYLKDLGVNGEITEKYHLTDAQRNELIEELQGIKTQLSDSKSALKSLLATLSKVHISKAYAFTQGEGEHKKTDPANELHEVKGQFSITTEDDVKPPPNIELKGVREKFFGTKKPEGFDAMSDFLTGRHIAFQDGKVAVVQSKSAGLFGAGEIAKSIAPAEEAVIGGKGGGLSDISEKLTAGSQKSANQSQTQQMKLQMVMTQVQQEWTIVSTALQILNQVNMTFAKAVYSM
ncbi:MAG: hypothetical protein S4CHLAM45_03550 [Chlamydiales bacterium]|nr:hypothetical protein [Chlamydiales bacterium]MCH9619210.1 hypothetical protein [Chlamydiales bacterium]MCH9622472.1 hypothetical protein [Chlamydiales bacterium]